MSAPLEIVNARVAQIKDAIEKLDENFERGGKMSIGDWQRKRGALTAQREVLTRSRPRSASVDIDRMSDPEFRAYSQEQHTIWESDARERLEACDELQRKAEAEEAQRVYPNDWHRTFIENSVNA